MSNTVHFLIGLNMLINGAIVIVCLGRLNASSLDVRTEVRAYFTLLLTGAMAYGLQAPLFGYIPTPAGVFMAFCVFMALMTSKARWRGGPPDDVKVDHCATMKEQQR